MTKGIEVREGRTELIVPHLEGKLTFVSPEFGPGTYFSLDEQIQASDFKVERPTMEQTASLVHSAWQNKDERYSSRIIQILKDNWFWAFNGLMYVPKEHEGKLIEGVYVEDRPKVRNGNILMDEKDILERTQKQDPAVRYVAPGFKAGELNYKDLAKNKLVIALAGEEGAEKLAEISRNYKLNPYMWIPSSDKIETRVVALGRGYDGRLDVNAGSSGDGGDGCAFGVCAPQSAVGEANARKK